jgi:nitroreductase
MDKPANTQYPVAAAIEARWSPRALKPESVSPEQMRSLLEAARWTASAFNEQPWRFIVALRDETEGFERMLGCLVPGNQQWAHNAGALILTVVRETFSRNDKPNGTARYDVGQAAAALALQATELGLRVHQMAGIDGDKIRQTYAVPEGYAPLTGIAVGYPGPIEGLPEGFRESETAPRERKPQAEFVFSGNWGDAAIW